MPSLPLIEGYMPLQMLGELVTITLCLTAISYAVSRFVGIHQNKLFQSFVLFLSYVLYLNFRIYPPMPFSMIITYTIGLVLAIFMWLSSCEEYWKETRKPIVAMLDGKTRAARACRAIVVMALPCVGAWATWTSLIMKIEEPTELRTVIPAPPNSFNAFGKHFSTHELRNPLRVNATGDYDQRFTDMLSAEEEGAGLMKPNANPWAPNVGGYLKSVREGGELYSQNCIFCHGANLNGHGHENFAFRPFATNFVQLRTVLYVEEGHEFWRTAGGGKVLPPEGFPWMSVMPPMEEHLTADEIWKVLLFKSWFTGGDPEWVSQLR